MLAKLEEQDQSNKMILEGINSSMEDQCHRNARVVETDVCIISQTILFKELYCKIRKYKIYNTLRPEKIGKGRTAMIIKVDKLLQKAKYKIVAIQATAMNVLMKSKYIPTAACWSCAKITPAIFLYKKKKLPLSVTWRINVLTY